VTVGEDNLLVEACRRGDPAAWETLVRRYRALIYGIARKWYELDPADAADVFQEVCVALFQQIAELRRPERLGSWIINVAVRQSRRVRARALASSGTLVRLSGVEPASSDPERARTQAEVFDALESLETRCREIFRLRFLEPRRMSYRQIAARLGLARGTIGPTRARCFKKLHAILRRRSHETGRPVAPRV
jgi:RNA polymerase sigma factor (sigma-70 family)